MKKTQHVVPRSDGQWSVKPSGSDKASKVFDTQKEAINYGKSIAKNQKTELYIHSKTGRIRDRNSYGNDTYPPKG